MGTGVEKKRKKKKKKGSSADHGIVSVCLKAAKKHQSLPDSPRIIFEPWRKHARPHSCPAPQVTVMERKQQQAR